jgi:hypothetical protein
MSGIDVPLRGIDVIGTRPGYDPCDASQRRHAASRIK